MIDSDCDPIEKMHNVELIFKSNLVEFFHHILCEAQLRNLTCSFQLKINSGF